MPGNSVEIKFSGSKRMRQKLERAGVDILRRVDKALLLEAEAIMARAKEDHVPVDLGTLRSSGKVGKPTRRGRDVEIVLSFGGAAAAYALAVHEHPSEHSPPSWGGKEINFSPDREGVGPKYLERPLKDAAQGMAARIAREI